MPRVATWVGDFAGTGSSQVLSVSGPEGNWNLGAPGANGLSFAYIGNTHDFGDVTGSPFWQGRFSGGSQDELLLYSPGDGQWRLGTVTGPPAGISWTPVGTQRFEWLLGAPTWVVDPDGSGTHALVAFTPVSWWQGRIDGGAMAWTQIGSSLGRGLIELSAIGQGRFIGDDVQLLAYEPKKSAFAGQPFLVTLPAGGASFAVEPITPGGAGAPDLLFGNPSSFWIGPFGASGADGVLLVDSSTGNWYVGEFSRLSGAVTLTFAETPIGNTSTLGQVTTGSAWVAPFTGGPLPDVLINSSADGAWRLGSLSAGTAGVDALSVSADPVALDGPGRGPDAITRIGIGGEPHQPFLVACGTGGAEAGQTAWWLGEYVPATQMIQGYAGELPVGPTQAQIAVVLPNLKALQDFNDYVYGHSQTGFLDALTAFSEQTSGDPGLGPVLSVLKAMLAGAAGYAPDSPPLWWNPAAQFIGSFAIGLVDSWDQSPPPSIDQPFIDWTERYKTTSMAFDQQLAAYAHDVAQHWDTTFTANGQAQSLSDLAFTRIPVEATDTWFVDLVNAAILSLQQSLFETILRASFVIREQPSLRVDGKKDTEPVAWAKSFYKQHPNAYAQWRWKGSLLEQYWHVDNWEIAAAPGTGYTPRPLSSDACGMLFIDGVPGQTINADGLFTREAVFTSLGLKNVSWQP